MASGSELADAGRAAFERRLMPVRGIADQAMSVAMACRDMAERFQAGGRLLVFGTGASATDAEHIAVEFVHPVIVGKRALPALSLASDAATMSGIAADCGTEEIFSHQIATLGRSGDIALGLTADGDEPAICRALESARSADLLVIALVGGDGGRIADTHLADHVMSVGSTDPLVVKEAHVTLYHLLWELVHVFFDTPDVVSPAMDDVQSLYPFLYGGSHDASEVVASVAASTASKVEEVVGLRAAVGDDAVVGLGECAAVLAEAFSRGGTLWAFGNGGSSTDAQDLVHAFLHPVAPGRPLAAVGLPSDSAIVTALANDVGFDVVFARQVRAFARSTDMAVGLSTSGGSANVLAALDAAKQMGLVTVGVAGYGGGRMAQSSSIDHLFVVASSSVHRVQEVQTTIYHVLWELTQLALSA